MLDSHSYRYEDFQDYCEFTFADETLNKNIGNYSRKMNTMMMSIHIIGGITTVLQIILAMNYYLILNNLYGRLI